MSPENSRIDISVLIVTCNSSDNIAKCLQALKDEISRNNIEILIFDNNSTDTTIRQIEAVCAEAKIIRNKKNIGFAAGVNYLADIAAGKYLLLLNPDFVIDSEAIEILVKAMASQPKAGAVTARLRFPDGTFQPNCRLLPNQKNIFYSRGSVIAREGISHNRYTLDDFSEITPIPAASATCLLIDREYFIKIGCFDPRFFMFMEDTDLCLRIHQTGHKIYFVPGAGGIHYWGQGASVSPVRRILWHHVSVWKYFLKHFPNGFSLIILPMALAINIALRLLTKKFDGRS